MSLTMELFERVNRIEKRLEYFNHQITKLNVSVTWIKWLVCAIFLASVLQKLL